MLQIIFSSSCMIHTAFFLLSHRDHSELKKLQSLFRKVAMVTFEFLFYFLAHRAMEGSHCEEGWLPEFSLSLKFSFISGFHLQVPLGTRKIMGSWKIAFCFLKTGTCLIILYQSAQNCWSLWKKSKYRKFKSLLFIKNGLQIALFLPWVTQLLSIFMLCRFFQNNHQEPFLVFY